MAKLEIQLGADSAELLRELSASEKLLKDWVTRVNTLKPKVSSTGIVEYSKETTAALNTEAVALAKATTETQQYKAEQAAAAAELAKFRTENATTAKTVNAAAGSYREAQQRLTALGKSIREAQGGFDGSRPSINAMIKEYNDLNSRLKTFDGSLGNFQRNVGNYQSALKGSNAVSIEFARIIEDAPFGIIGIGNNIQQLTSNYQNYANSVKAAAAEQGKQVSSGAILKGALSGLLTPTSLLTLGVAAVTTAYTAYTMWSQKAAKSDQEKAKNTRSAKEALDEYINSLDASTRSQVKGIENSQEEITKLRLLYDASRNLKLPMEERVKAAKQLQDQYPKTFENFSAEQIALGKASGAYKELAKDIIAVAKAAARTDIIVQNEKEIVQLEQKRKALEKQLKTQKEIDARSLADAKRTTITGGGIAGTTNAGDDLVRANQELYKQKEINQQLKDLDNRRAILRRENLGLEKEITKEQVTQQSVDSILPKGGQGKPSRRVETTKKEVDEIAKIYKTLETDLIVNEGQFGATAFDIAKKNVDSYQKAIDDLKKKGIDPLSDSIKKLEEQQLRAFQNGYELQAITNKLVSPIGIKDTRLKGSDGKVQAAGLNPNVAVSQDNSYITRAIRSSINSVINDTVSGFATIGQRNYDIEKKYSDMRIGATQEQIKLFTEMERLEKSVSTGLLSTLTNVFQSLNKGISDIFVKGLSDQLSKKISEGDFKLGANISQETSKAIVAGAQLAGGLISGIVSPTSAAGQGIGGAISGIGTGSALASVLGATGPWGAIAGGLIGAIGGIFGAGARKKQEELQRQQVELQKKQLEEQKRLNALAYTSSIIGQMTNQGLVTSVDRDAYGNIVAKIQGSDILLVTERALTAKKRGG